MYFFIKGALSHNRKECDTMLKSMTGFGRSEIATKERKVIVEIKSVNHRYCDISIKLPKKLSFFEAGIRNLLKQYIGRGKVDVFINYEDYTENTACVKFNEDLAREYLANLVKLSEELNLKNDITTSSLSRYPDVFTLEEQSTNEDELWALIEKAIIEAAEKFVETRIAEGQNLKEDLFAKIEGMLGHVAFIEERSPLIVLEYRERLTAKVQELLGDTKIDESILATELDRKSVV